MVVSRSFTRPGDGRHQYHQGMRHRLTTITTITTAAAAALCCTGCSGLDAATYTATDFLESVVAGDYSGACQVMRGGSDSDCPEDLAAAYAYLTDYARDKIENDIVITGGNEVDGVATIHDFDILLRETSSSWRMVNGQKVRVKTTAYVACPDLTPAGDALTLDLVDNQWLVSGGVFAD